VLALLMLALLAAALARGEAQPLPLWPQWGAAVDAAGGRVGAALLMASTVPIILNCFACHQVLMALAQPAARGRGSGDAVRSRDHAPRPSPRRIVPDNSPPPPPRRRQSLHPLLPSLRPYSTRRAQGMVATSLAIAAGLYYVIGM
jgi:hypothetical protein